MVISERIPMAQGSCVNARDGTESSMRMGPYAYIQGVLTALKIILPVMDQQERPYLLCDLTGKRLFNPIGSHQYTLGRLNGGDSEVVVWIDFGSHRN
jgi:hypothetical protein